MDSPRYPGRDLRLDPLGNRDGLRPAPQLGEIAHVASQVPGASSTREALAAYQALIDAVFTAPGAAEWLRELRKAVAAFLAKGEPPHAPKAAPSDAIRAADPGPGRA
jgi:hypothetical protein